MRTPLHTPKYGSNIPIREIAHSGTIGGFYIFDSTQICSIAVIMDQDVRWKQRYANYKKALYKLTEAIDYMHVQTSHSEGIHDVAIAIAREGLIQRFEYTHELAWNTMKDYATYQGNFDIKGSRDATREAFKTGLIKEGEIWMNMLMSRNNTSHTYNEATAIEIYQQIIQTYHPALIAFAEKMEGLSILSQQ
jgi:nucleotidyltransferase substrate binding protein (TIGR01987 family)